MTLPTNNASNLSPPIDDPTKKLASIDARSWFLGCGIGCATGLSALYAIITVWDGSARWPAIPALLVALIHATIVTMLWQFRYDLQRRTAVTASMTASSVLLFVLAMAMGNNGLPTSPLFAFALIHLLLAFFHPLAFKTNTDQS